MITLREIYDTKRKLIDMDKNELTDMINSDEVSALLNEDNTIRIESEEGVNRITESIDRTLPIWSNDSGMKPPIHLFYNLFPISKTTCLLKI